MYKFLRLSKMFFVFPLEALSIYASGQHVESPCPVKIMQNFFSIKSDEAKECKRTSFFTQPQVIPTIHEFLTPVESQILKNYTGHKL